MNIVFLQMIFFFFKVLGSVLGWSVPENSGDYRKNGFIFIVWLYWKISFYVYILHKFYLVEFTWTQFSYLVRLFSFSSWDTSEEIDRNNCYLQCRLTAGDKSFKHLKYHLYLGILISMCQWCFTKTQNFVLFVILLAIAMLSTNSMVIVFIL